MRTFQPSQGSILDRSTKNEIKVGKIENNPFLQKDKETRENKTKQNPFKPARTSQLTQNTENSFNKSKT